MLELVGIRRISDSSFSCCGVGGRCPSRGPLDLRYPLPACCSINYILRPRAHTIHPIPNTGISASNEIDGLGNPQVRHSFPSMAWQPKVSHTSFTPSGCHRLPLHRCERSFPSMAWQPKLAILPSSTSDSIWVATGCPFTDARYI